MLKVKRHDDKIRKKEKEYHMELVDIVDENNKLTGQVEDRWKAYNKGLWRRTVSCWIMNEKGEVLLQKRTANKKKPNKKTPQIFFVGNAVFQRIDDVKHLFVVYKAAAIGNFFNTGDF